MVPLLCWSAWVSAGVGLLGSGDAAAVRLVGTGGRAWQQGLVVMVAVGQHERMRMDDGGGLGAAVWRRANRA
jgi:hypothetical protein